MEKMEKVLGPPYKVIDPGLNIKPYPCCRGAHRSIDCALALQKKVKVEEIQSIECDLHLDGPTLYLYPRTGLEGKFSIAYCVAIGLLEGKVELETFSDSKVSDTAVQQLMKKVIDLRMPGEEEVITVRLQDGRTISHSVLKAKGDARTNPLSDEELAEKFKSCARRVLPAAKIRQAVKQISRMEKVADLRLFLEGIMEGV